MMMKTLTFLKADMQTPKSKSCYTNGVGAILLLGALFFSAVGAAAAVTEVVAGERAVKGGNSAYTPAKPIMDRQLKIIAHDKSPYCYHLNPLITGAPMTEGAYVELASCTEDHPPPVWTFDVNGRISMLYTDLDYCIELPRSVIEGKAKWGWLIVNRCDMGSVGQQWHMDDERRIKSLFGNYEIRDSNYFLFAGDVGGGNRHTVSTEMDSWIANISVPRSYNFKIDLNWRDGTSRYYSNYAADNYFHMRSTANDSFTSLYDPFSKKLSFQHNNGVNMEVAYCLVSNTGPGATTFQYTSLATCDVVSETPSNQRWTMVPELGEKSSEQQAVNFFNTDGDVLKVFAKGGAWGYPYTIPVEAIPKKEKPSDTAKSAFYVNIKLDEMRQFMFANEQNRTLYCPAKSGPVSGVARVNAPVKLVNIPDTFDFTEEWQTRLARIGAMPGDDTTVGDLCGTCSLESMEIIRQIQEQQADGSPPERAHLFDLNSSVTIQEQVRLRYPRIDAAVTAIRQRSRADFRLLRQNRGSSPAAMVQYATEYARLSAELYVSGVQAFLPDFAVVRELTIPYFLYVNSIETQVNSAFDQAPVGTTILASFWVQLLDPPEGSGHSFPIVRTAQGWVPVEVARPGSPPEDFTPYNRSPHDSPYDALSFYMRNREPYVNQRGQNNINFNLNNVVHLVQVERRPPPSLVSFGNCTGEGHDGARGSGPAVHGTPTQNLCLDPSGAASRCFVSEPQ